MKTTSVVAVALLTFALFGVRLVAAPATARALPSLMPAPETALRHATEIGLTAEQLARLEADVRQWEAAAREFAEQVRQESDALARLLAGDRLDETAVAMQFEKVLKAEDEVKRVRLKMSLCTRAALTPEQVRKLALLQSRGGGPRVVAPDQQELAAQMERVKMLIQRSKQAGRDLSKTRAMWKRVNQLTNEGQFREAIRVLDEAAKELEAGLNAPSPNL